MQSPPCAAGQSSPVPTILWRGFRSDRGILWLPCPCGAGEPCSHGGGLGRQPHGASFHTPRCFGLCCLTERRAGVVLFAVLNLFSLKLNPKTERETLTVLPAKLQLAWVALLGETIAESSAEAWEASLQPVVSPGERAGSRSACESRSSWRS